MLRRLSLRGPGSRLRQALGPLAAIAIVVSMIAAAPPYSRPRPAASPVRSGPSNASFESWSGHVSRCWQIMATGHGRASLAPSRAAHSGRLSALVTVRKLGHGATRALVTSQRVPACTPAPATGHRARVGMFYRATVPVQLVVMAKTARGWRRWVTGPVRARSKRWVRMSLTTPPKSSTITALSFGLRLTRPGSALVDDASWVDVSPAPAAHTPGTQTPSSPTPTSEPVGNPDAPTTPAPSNPPQSVHPPSEVVAVSTAAQFSAALASARPGRVISLAAGVYRGNFTLRNSGTAADPIRVAGPRGAVIDGGNPATGFALHLDGADHVVLDGFSVSNAQKALVLDESDHDTLTNLDMHSSGDEVLVLRNYSSDNVVSANLIHDAGLTEPPYGEGVYVGLSSTNWNKAGQSRTAGAPDHSDRNQIIGNTIWNTTAESIDIKEGTTGGVVKGNHLNSTGMTGANDADSWIDIAGNNYQVLNNVGVNPGSALVDGIQTHRILAGWANGNTFAGNNLTVNASGFGVYVQTPKNDNIVKTDNRVTGASRGISNVPVGY
jgi:hypothetical protein